MRLKSNILFLIYCIRLLFFYRYSNVSCNDKCLNSLLPGPTTVVFKSNNKLTKTLELEISKIGFRIPNSKFLTELIKYTKEPLVITNLISPSPLNIYEFEILWNHIDIIVDGGLLGFEDDPKSRDDSTVVDLSIPGTYKILREGTFYESTITKLEKTCKLIHRKV